MDYCNKINSAFVNGFIMGGVGIPKALILEVVPKILNWLTKNRGNFEEMPATLPTGKFPGAIYTANDSQGSMISYRCDNLNIELKKRF